MGKKRSWDLHVDFFSNSGKYHTNFHHFGFYDKIKISFFLLDLDGIY